MTQDHTETIRAEMEALSAKATRLRSQLDAVERDRADLETALRVLERLTGVPSRSHEPKGDAGGATMPDLILQALEAGPRAVADLTSSVAFASNKSVDANNIRSTAWRMWKAGRIAKTGDEYHLIGQITAFNEGNGQVDLA